MSDEANYIGLNQLGGASALPAAPEEAVLERVESPHRGTDYVEPPAGLWIPSQDVPIYRGRP